MSNMILHLSTVHHYSDTRIQKRMCNSASEDFNIGLMCHDAERIQDTGFRKFSLGKKPKKFLNRIFFKIPKALFYVIQIRPKIVHLHDPELFIFTLILPFFNMSVIIDIHEDYWTTVSSKYYLHPIIRKPIAFIAKVILNISCKYATKIIIAWPKIGDNLKYKFIVINNYPRIKDYPFLINKEFDSTNFIFSGVISFERGFKEALLLFEKYYSETPKKFIIVGRFSSELEKIYFYENYSLDSRFEYFEWMDQNSLMKLMLESHFGFIFFHDIPNHRHSIPNKLFEYIACGVIPLTSNLPFLSEFIENHKCGVTNDIFNTQNYLLEIQRFMNNSNDLQNLLSNVKNQYSWEIEYSKLHKLYKSIL